MNRGGSPEGADRMKCPHCHTAFHDKESTINVGNDAEGSWRIIKSECPECHKCILFLESYELVGINTPGKTLSRTIIRPKGSSQLPAPLGVPPEIAEDYNEACVVLPDSPKASAALSRRCLQNLLRSAAQVKQGDLAKEIQQVLDSDALPTYLAESIDAIRNIGNFAAHPNKSLQSGEIIPVEPGEAEWNLDVLEELFDFYYVKPAVIAKKRAELDSKLAAAGKPPMK
jgi:hypothetical protein